jgi:Ca-activated chloride channel family protein
LVLLVAIKFLVPVLFVVAMAQPYIEVSTRTPVTMDNVLEANASAKIIVLLDISKSMNYTDTYPSRLENALVITRGIAEYAVPRNDSLEVYGFSKTTKILCTNLTSLDAVDSCIEGIKSIELEKYSAIGDALYYGYSKSKTSPLPPVIVLITDGGWNYGSPVEDAVRTLVHSSIPLVVVIVGRDSRASRLIDACRAHNVTVVKASISSGDEDLLDYLSQSVYVSAKYEALKSAGVLYVYVSTRDYSIQLFILFASLAIFIASLVEGV